MSKGQTRLLVILQICTPRGVVVADGEEVAVGAPPAHVPGMRFGARLDDVQRLHAGVRRAQLQVLVTPVRKLNLSSSRRPRAIAADHR